MAFKPPKFSKDEVSQTINLKEQFGIDFTGLEDFRDIIGEAIIQKIKERTESGQGVSFSGENARPVTLKGYSKEYKDSPEFKAFGKTSKVNMTLSGDMLNLMDVIDHTANTIKIGWDDGEQNAKSYNHNVGDTVPRRPFFGISKTELQEIVNEIKPDLKAALKARDKIDDEDLYAEKLKQSISNVKKTFGLDVSGGEEDGS